MRERLRHVRCEPPLTCDRMATVVLSSPVLSCGEPATSLMQSALFSSVTTTATRRPREIKSNPNHITTTISNPIKSNPIQSSPPLRFALATVGHFCGERQLEAEGRACCVERRVEDLLEHELELVVSYNPVAPCWYS